MGQAGRARQVSTKTQALQCWSDKRDEHADLAGGPRGANEGNGCRNGRRHADHDHEKRGGEVERAQEPQLAVRDQIQGLHMGFDVVVDAGAAGRLNLGFAEAAACSFADRLMRHACAWIADSPPPPDLLFAPFPIGWCPMARASSFGRRLGAGPRRVVPVDPGLAEQPTPGV